MKSTIFIPILGLCLAAAAVLAADTHRAVASAQGPVTLSSGLNETRPTIPIAINGSRFDCVLDTGTSAIIVSPSVAEMGNLPRQSATSEVSPDGRTHTDFHTTIAHFGVAGYRTRNVAALVSSNLSGADVLCGYDFFARYPTLIDRDRQSVTLFPVASAINRLHCLLVDLAPHVPLATVEINGTWVDHVVLDSGMVGGGALWDGVRERLREPLVADANYETDPSAVREGLACGASAGVRLVAGAPRSAMPICTESQRPDGYNGILETYLPTIHAMAIDYPHHRICFGTNGSAQLATWHATGFSGNAWTRFNNLRAVPPRP